VGTISKYIQQHRQISVGFEIVRASFQKICKGHFGSWLAIAFLGGLLAVWALVIALFLPQFRWPAALLVLGYLIVAAVMAVAMLARTTGYLLDLAANVSLQSQLKRVGFSAPDFFVDCGAGSPTLQLTLVKVLSLCQPSSILELGAGQTTKIPAHYGRTADPEAERPVGPDDRSVLERQAIRGQSVKRIRPQRVGQIGRRHERNGAGPWRPEATIRLFRLDWRTISARRDRYLIGKYPPMIQTVVLLQPAAR